MGKLSLSRVQERQTYSNTVPKKWGFVFVFSYSQVFWSQSFFGLLEPVDFSSSLLPSTLHPTLPGVNLQESPKSMIFRKFFSMGSWLAGPVPLFIQLLFFQLQGGSLGPWFLWRPKKDWFYLFAGLVGVGISSFYSDIPVPCLLDSLGRDETSFQCSSQKYHSQRFWWISTSFLSLLSVSFTFLFWPFAIDHYLRCWRSPSILQPPKVH